MTELIQPNLKSIPAALQAEPQWVNFRHNKKPVDPNTGKLAKADNPATWSSFAQAVKYFEAHRGNGIRGIGYEFGLNGGPVTGIDLDKFRYPDGSFKWCAQFLIEAFSSYAEISPSGTGAHILVEGRFPDVIADAKTSKMKTGYQANLPCGTKIEFYDRGRYFTVTGYHINGTPSTVEPRQQELDRLYQIFVVKPERSTDNTCGDDSEVIDDTPLPLTDSEVIEIASKAKNGQKFMNLYYRGDISGYGGDDSKADFALCELFAFYTNGDHAQIERLFNGSALGKRDKWKDRSDYRRITIEKAIANTPKFYTASKPKNTTGSAQARGDIDKSIQNFNAKHAGVMIGGKFCVMNFITDPTFNRPDITLSSVSDIRNKYANRKVIVPGPDGKSRDYKLSDLWLNSEDRRDYEGITFMPGSDVPGYFNLWRGLAVEPRPGDWSLFREHMRQVICGGVEEYFRYLKAWLAQLYQEPGGERPGVAVVLPGKQGTGKGIFANTVGRALGSHYLHISSPVHLTGRFNNHLKDACLVFLDEAVWGGDKSSEGRLKAMITEDQELVEAKGKDAYTVKNFKRIIIASNNSWVIPAGLEERRFFVLNVADTYQQNHEYFKAIIDQMKNGGYEGMLYDLLEYDYSGVNLRQAPKTEALFEQIVQSMDPLKKFWYQRLQDGLPLTKDYEYHYENQTNPTTRLAWGDLVPCDILYRNYVYFCREILNFRFPLIPNQFGAELRKLCPDIERKRPRILGRLWCYKFPPLSECRESFEKLFRGFLIPWEEPEDNLSFCDENMS